MTPLYISEQIYAGKNASLPYNNHNIKAQVETDLSSQTA